MWWNAFIDTIFRDIILMLKCRDLFSLFETSSLGLAQFYLNTLKLKKLLSCYIGFMACSTCWMNLGKYTSKPQLKLRKSYIFRLNMATIQWLNSPPPTIRCGLITKRSVQEEFVWQFVTPVSLAILNFKYRLALQKLSNKDNVDKIL